MQKQTIKLTVLVEMHTQTSCDLKALSTYIRGLINASDPTIENVTISDIKLLPKAQGEAIVTTDIQNRDVIVFPKEGNYAELFIEWFATHQTQDMISVNLLTEEGYYSVNIDTESIEELDKIAAHLNANAKP